MTRLDELDRSQRWQLEWLANGFGYLASPLVYEKRGRYRGNNHLQYKSVTCHFCASEWESSSPEMLQFELRNLGWVYTTRPCDGNRRVRHRDGVHIWTCPRCIRHTFV